MYQNQKTVLVFDQLAKNFMKHYNNAALLTAVWKAEKQNANENRNEVKQAEQTWSWLVSMIKTGGTRVAGGGGGEEEGASGIKLNGHCHYELSLIYQLSICGHFKPHIIFSIKKI